MQVATYTLKSPSHSYNGADNTPEQSKKQRFFCPKHLRKQKAIRQIRKAFKKGFDFSISRAPAF